MTGECPECGFETDWEYLVECPECGYSEDSEPEVDEDPWTEDDDFFE